tara:strand:- start:203 stop:664 length:462 start_codon:yes stop_codon:yes gene_type:complete
MRNKNKGFTLIELLVVVAIIGILAAVGVVAYNGYTSAAKKNAVKTIHAQTTKYIAAELQKCALEGTAGKAFGASSANCPVNATTAATLAAAAMTDKNPYTQADAHVANSTLYVEGQVSLKGINSSKEVTIRSCFYDNPCSNADNQVTSVVTID